MVVDTMCRDKRREVVRAALVRCVSIYVDVSLADWVLQEEFEDFVKGAVLVPFRQKRLCVGEFSLDLPYTFSSFIAFLVVLRESFLVGTSIFCNVPKLIYTGNKRSRFVLGNERSCETSTMTSLSELMT